MARMGLDHDRAPGRQRRGRVAAGDAEGEQEVAGGENQDGAERVQDPPQVGRGAPIGQSESAWSIRMSR